MIKHDKNTCHTQLCTTLTAMFNVNLG